MFYGNERDRLGNYIEQIRGVSYKPKDLKDTTEGAYTLLRANNISNGVLNQEDVQYVINTKVSEKQLIKEDDLLMCASSGSLEHVGKIALCTSEYYGMTFGAFCKLLRSLGILSAQYLSIYFRTDEYRNIISGLACGSNINNLRNEHVDELMIPIPTEEQELQIIELVRQCDKSKFELQDAIDNLDALSKKIIAENLIAAGKE